MVTLNWPGLDYKPFSLSLVVLITQPDKARLKKHVKMYCPRLAHNTGLGFIIYSQMENNDIKIVNR